MTEQQLKEAAFAAIDQNAGTIAGIAHDLLGMPELGFREWKTAGYVEKQMRALGMEDIRTGIARTGLCGRFHGSEGSRSAGKPPVVAVFGELDAIFCPEHPFADPETGAAHACGHHAQVTAMLGAAIGLKAMMPYLDGDVLFMGIPAEEGISSDFAEDLRQEGQRFFSGKQEMYRLGAFEGVDACLSIHSGFGIPGQISVPMHTNTILKKTTTFIGRQAHPGGESHLGINALSCATVALAAVDALRQTFRPQDHINVNSRISYGGAVGTIPERCVVETVLRSSTREGLVDASRKLDRAMRGGAMAIGGEAVIHNQVGPMQQNPSQELADLVASCGKELSGDAPVFLEDYACVVSDVGDLSQFIPTVQATVAGFDDFPHRAGFVAQNDYLAYLLPAKLMAACTISLLCGGGQKLKKVCGGFHPGFSWEEYLAFGEGLSS